MMSGRQTGPELAAYQAINTYVLYIYLSVKRYTTPHGIEADSGPYEVRSLTLQKPRAQTTCPRQVIGTLKGHDDKVRVVLNKSDQVDQQQLMRVYGALMWSLGKVIRSPEVRPGRPPCTLKGFKGRASFSSCS